MLLAVDIGNSQTTIGLVKDGAIEKDWRLETSAFRTSDEYASLLLPLLQHAGYYEPGWNAVGLCSVVPSASRSFSSFCDKYFGMKPLQIHNGLDFGLTSVNVHFPQEVGADRLVNSAYAVKYLELPAIVVDFGTATTLDVIGTERSYEGGVIIPGVELGLKALAHGTAKLTAVEIKAPPSVIGKNTPECIQSGLVYGYAEMLTGLIRRTEAELGQSASVVLTGGIAPLYDKHIALPHSHVPHLTLLGIETIHQKNQ